MRFPISPSIAAGLTALAIILTVLPVRAEWAPVTVPVASAGEKPGAPRWYRCFIQVEDNMAIPREADLYRDSVMLHLGGMQGPVEALFNGRKVAEAPQVPSDRRRRFKIAKDILQKTVFNCVVIKASSEMAMAPILSGYFNELRMEGPWEVSTTEPKAAEMSALPNAPAVAGYDQKLFHPTSSAWSATETMPGASLPPQESLKKMTTADDLKVDLVLAEPLVAQPTHLSFDERGRMWVSQYRQYPYPAGLRMIARDRYYRARFDKVPPAPPHQDRGNDIISVHESTKGDGVYDKNKVVLDGLNMVNAAVYGHGGIWVMNTPYLLFYPDAKGTDIPERDPEVRLSGFGMEDTHSVSNGLVWGPDGWLYGGQGSTCTCRVVRPGIDPLNAPGVYYAGQMVWRYQPERKIFELFAEGGGNTFGLDFDSEGNLFSGHNGGVTRGWHFVPNGLYVLLTLALDKQAPNPHPFAFGNLESMKSSNPISRFSHATIIAEGSALPSHYMGRIFAADPLHRNVVIAERYPKGSTFTTSDSGVALAGADPSFRPVYMTNAPDGGIYVADFYEEFIAHGQHYQGQIDATTGRIYRLSGKDLPLNRDVNLAAKTTPQLIETLSHPNRWHRQTAVRVIAGRHEPSAIEPLKALLQKPETHPALEALWTLYQLGALDEPTALAALDHPAAPVRSWTIRLLGDANVLSAPFAARVLKLAETEPDPQVRSQMASTARRLSAAQALPIVGALLRRDIDNDDPFIPLLCWWVIEQHSDADRTAVLALLDEPAAWNSAMMKKQILGRLMRRFATTEAHADLMACVALLQKAPSAEHRKLLVAGFEAAFEGRALPLLPDELVKALAASGSVSPLLRVRLGEPEAVAAALKVAQDLKAKATERLSAVRLFGEVKTAGAVPALTAVAADDSAPTELRKAAVISLLLYDDPSIGAATAAAYPTLPEEIRPAALNLLASRSAWSKSLLAMIASGRLRPADVPPDLIARLRTHQDADFQASLTKIFPDAPAVSQKTFVAAEIQRVRSLLAIGAGDPYKGEATFMQRCAICHTLFFKGGHVGPELTAYQRDDLGTLLPSIVDPSAEIREGFENYLVTTNDGRSLSGLMADKDAAVLVLRGIDGQNVSIPRNEVKEMKRFEKSLMPDGLLTGLSDQELRDFFAYLRISQPITK